MLYEPDPRFAGISKWNYWKLWNFSIEGITSFSIEPLKVATYIGIIIAILAILYAFYMVIQTIISGNPVPSFPSLLVATLISRGSPAHVSRGYGRISWSHLQRSKAEASLSGETMGPVGARA